MDQRGWSGERAKVNQGTEKSRERKPLGETTGSHPEGDIQG